MAHSGIPVIGYDYSDAIGQRPQRGQRTFRSHGHTHLEPRISQYRFADL